ncbi:capsid and scaffold protein [Klebsiella phage KPP2018]|uniref:Capsid and scaffold protein n=4 Tax=Tequintavirus TaxID=187218 RepID=A0AAF0APM3_9CAUD|nr:capsid and scaffold A [Salmonella phage vB_Sen-E22]WBF69855.1 capsid and scaffold protein [Klebsiella phage KPP2018]WBF69922.1 capsid and scaffold protein [Klebsiella phage KPP2018]
MTEKKNPLLEQMKEWESNIESGLVDGEDIVNSMLEVTIDNIDPILASETSDLIGLSIAFDSLAKLALDDEEITKEDLASAMNMAINAYIGKRTDELDKQIKKRDTTLNLMETATMLRSGKQLH